MPTIDNVAESRVQAVTIFRKNSPPVNGFAFFREHKQEPICIVPSNATCYVDVLHEGMWDSWAYIADTAFRMKPIVAEPPQPNAKAERNE